MAVIATLALGDGQATPVNHNFTPVGVKNGIAMWKDKASGIPAKYPVLTYSLREPTKALPSHKLTTKITLPGVDALTNVKIREAFVNVDVVIPESCTDQERKDLAAFASNFVLSAVFQNGVKTNEAVWG